MIRHLILAALTTLLFSNILAQDLTKTEKKALLEEIKLMKNNPALLKYLKESIDVKDVIIEQQSVEVINSKKKVQQQQIQLNAKSDSINKLMAEVDYALNSADCLLNVTGFHYRVQIGLYRDFNISQYLNEPKFIVYEKLDDLYRYSVGNFEEESTAEFFAKEMRNLGINGAFVSKYKDGVRILDEPVQPKQTPVKEETKTNTNTPKSVPASLQYDPYLSE